MEILVRLGTSKLRLREAAAEAAQSLALFISRWKRVIQSGENDERVIRVAERNVQVLNDVCTGAANTANWNSPYKPESVYWTKRLEVLASAFESNSPMNPTPRRLAKLLFEPVTGK